MLPIIISNHSSSLSLFHCSTDLRFKTGISFHPKAMFTGKKITAAPLEKGVVLVTFSNPENKNAFDQEMAEEARSLYPVLRQKNPRVLVFAGAGEVFSAGGDFKLIEELIRTHPRENKKDLLHFYKSFIRLAQFNCPTIAWINGHAVGAGFVFAMACDLRYAVNSAKVGMNFTRIGIAPGMGAEYWLRQIPPVIAREMVFTGKTYSAVELEKFQIFNECSDPETIAAKVKSIALQIAANSRKAIRFSIENLRNSRCDAAQVMKKNAAAQARCFAGKEMPQALEAFRKKEEYFFRD